MKAFLIWIDVQKILSQYFCRQEKDEVTPSPKMIREQRLQTLQEQRPSLTDRQLEILLSSWRVIQDHEDTLGGDMFNRLGLPPS